MPIGFGGSYFRTMGDGTRAEASRIEGATVGLLVRPEESSDDQAILEVQAAAFGDSVHIAALLTALRSNASRDGVISLVACLGHQIVGHVVLSPGRLDAPRQIVEVLTLSPLGVMPEYQGRGIGTHLIGEALRFADSAGAPLVFLEGDPTFYGTRGFERADQRGFRSPSLRIPPAAFQVAILSVYEPWMTGTFVYSETFWAEDAVGLREVED